MHVIYLVDPSIKKERAFKALSDHFEDVGDAYLIKVPVEDGRVNWKFFGRNHTSAKALTRKYLMAFIHLWGDEGGLEELFKQIAISLP